MNALFSAIAAAAFAANPPAPGSPSLAITVGQVNPTTTLLLTPATGQVVIAIEVNSLLLIPNRSPALAVPLIDVNARPANNVQLLTGPR